MIKQFLLLIGIQLDTTEHKEKLISALGGLVSIFAILWVSQLFLDLNSAALIVASMGASAVLLFAVPHGLLSQPWPVIAGHLVSATIGVSSFILVSDKLMAASIAVGLSIAVMYYARCIHPPGGATALSAVVGGEQIHQLGYEFIVTPVLLNVLIIIFIAVIFNYPFAWRRYPNYLCESYKAVRQKSPQIGRIPKQDLEFALKSMQSFTDISEIELERIYQTATSHQLERHLSPDDIKLGHYYLHGQKDGNGVIRRVIDESKETQGMIIYKVITGPNSKTTDVTTREAFAKWAKHEVVFVNNEWQIK